jgi:hypothetical protein
LVTFVTAGDAATQSGVAAVACATSKVRGLSPRAPVNVKLLSPNSLRAVIVQITTAQVAAIPLAGTTITLHMLGALGPKQDLAAINRSQYNVNAAASYDPHTKTLYVRSSSAKLTPLDRGVIAHEYTRALQDQYFGLVGLLTDSGGKSGRNSDALLARASVVEGDAFTTMLNFAATFSRQDLVLFNQELQQSGPIPADFAHDHIGFPAAHGTTFVKFIMTAAAKGKKGDAATAAGLAAVNHALANPPASTKEILNPTAYLQHSQSVQTLSIPTGTMDQAWQVVDSDVLGAFGIDDLFNQHDAPDVTARAGDDASSGWQGDRWVIYQHGADYVLIWRGHFSSAAAAQAFQRAMLSYTSARFHSNLATAAPVDWHTTGYAMSLRGRDTEVALVIGSSADLLATCARAISLMGFK